MSSSRSSDPAPEQLAAWRAQVDKELAGAPFDKLIYTTAEGFAIQPLYTERAVDPGLPGAAPYARGGSAEARPFQICMRVDPPALRRPGALAEDVEAGADALWIGSGDGEAADLAARHDLVLVEEDPATPSVDVLGERTRRVPHGSPEQQPSATRWSAHDPVATATSGLVVAEALPEVVGALAAVVRGYTARPSLRRCVRVSSLAFHDAGADAADELALILSTAAAYLRALVAEGLELDRVTEALWVQVAVGRDTFGELCKLRALRVVWHKLLAAAGARDTALAAMHAVCSSRTVAHRDPWVNMLRVTTQVFAAALGGAQLITPLSFDDGSGAASAQGRRLARNTALILREESHLGRVIDPAGGAYYVEARTDALAREAWSRFTQLERDGGIIRALVTGALRERLGAAWSRRAAAIARRKEPVLGVSEFANLGEQLPASAAIGTPIGPAKPVASALAAHRDGEAFESLRDRIEAAPRDVVLVTMGPPIEHRARAGYAASLFATAGLRTRELAAPDGTAAIAEASGGIDIACLCGSDERYAGEAVARAGELRAAGARKIVLAGRPGAREAELRAAGIDAFIYMGCDVLATLTELVAGARRDA